LIHDRDLRSRMVERGHHRVREFSWETTASRVLEVLETAGRHSSV
jgi:glycosyltransferase involved in cell wall biosynthesis